MRLAAGARSRTDFGRLLKICTNRVLQRIYSQSRGLSCGRAATLEALEPRQLLAASPMITEFLASNDLGLNDLGLKDIEGDSSD